MVYKVVSTSCNGKDLTHIKFLPRSVYYLPFNHDDFVRRLASCFSWADAEDVAIAMSKHTRHTFISTDDEGNPKVWGG